MILGEVDIQRVRLVDMNPAVYNPRKMTDEARRGLGASIDQFGLLSLIIWNKRTGNIVGGHQRYRKLVEDGELETDVVVVDLDDDDEVALNLVLNNEFARGTFSSDVKSILEKVEVQIGSLFNELRLNDLHEQISAASKDKGTREPSGGGEPPEPPPKSEEDAIIVCPHCKSMWRVDDEEVIKDAYQEDGKQVDS